MVNSPSQAEFSPEQLHEYRTLAIELAGLVGGYFARSKRFSDMKEIAKVLQALTKEDKQMLKHLKSGYSKMSAEAAEELARSLSKQSSDEPKKAKGGLADLLNEEVGNKAFDRIRELYSIPEVKDIYFEEMDRRKADFELLKAGYKGLPVVQLSDDLIGKAKDKILDVEVKAFTDRRQPTSNEASLIRRLEKGIEKETEAKNETLQGREVATAYRLNELQSYKAQLDDTGYVMLPSRKEIVEEIQRKLLLGHNILLNGPTGTGKTALAIEAVKALAKKMNIQFEEIKGKDLAIEMEKDEKGKKQLEDFTYVLSGHSGITPAEFIAKTKLEGNIATTTQLGKILKAFVEGKIPIIDEIDLIPNDVLMRIKHIFALRAGALYSPQEDSNEIRKLLTTTVIATANLKSEKHQDREDIDPAIARLFTGVYVSYLPEEELYDFSLVKLMRPQGYIEHIGQNALTDKAKGALPLLIQACKDIEENYMGHGLGETIGNKSKQFLKKSVLELGQFSKMLDGYHGKIDFNAFIIQKVVDFIGSATEKNDKLILLKIFSAKGLITKENAQQLIKKTGLSQAEITNNVITNTSSLMEDEVQFIDPYQLANLDPYGKRNLNMLEVSDKQKALQTALQFASSELLTLDNIEDAESMSSLIDEALTTAETSDELPRQDITKIMDGLVALAFKAKEDTEKGVIVGVLDHLAGLGGAWAEIHNLQKQELEKLFEAMKTKPAPKKAKDSKEATDGSLSKYIVMNSSGIVDKLKADGKTYVEGGELASNLTSDEIQNIKAITEDNIELGNSTEKEITIDGQKEKIVMQDIVIEGREYRAISIPEGIRNKPLSQLELGKRLQKHKDNGWFVNMDFSKSLSETSDGKQWIVWEKANRRKGSDIYVNIQTYNKSEKTDVLRETLKGGMKPISIADNIVLGEIIKHGLGEDYIDFLPVKADADESGYEKVRQKIEKVDEYLGMKFGEYNSSGYIIRNWGLYIDKDNDPTAFLRGDNDARGCTGGVASLKLRCYVDDQRDALGFRSSV